MVHAARNAVNLPERICTKNSPLASRGVLRSDRTVTIIITAFITRHERCL